VAYAVNSAGTLAGSLLAGFALIPWLGVQGTQLVAALVSIGAGVAAVVLARRAGEVGPRGLGLAAAALVLGIALMSTAPRWDSALMSAGLYRPVETRKVTAAAGVPGLPAVFGSTRAERTLFYREGVNGSVYVASDSTGRYRWLKVGGKTDASTGDMLTQVLLGVLPGAIAPPGGRAAVIGLGSGITLQALLATGVGPVDVMEIEPAVVEASRFFDEPGRHPLDDPRVTLVLSDARTHLVHAGRTWDVIVSEPSNPWIAGVNGLFTVDFYRRLRRSLAPDGVFCQWMQLYELSPGTLGSMLGSFLEVFPSGHAFFVRGSEDLLLVAAPAGRTLMLGRLRTPEVRRQLERARQLGPESVAAWYACPFDSLRALSAGLPLNRDDRPVVEYRAPRDLYRVGRAGGTPPGVSRVPPARWASARTLLSGWTEEDWYEGRARQLARSGEHASALAEARAASRAGFPALGAALERGVEEDRVSRAVVEAQEEARRAAAAGHPEQSRDALRRAATLDPEDGRTWVLLAETLRRLGDPQAAREAAVQAHAVGRPTDRADACVVEGLIAIAEGRAREAAAEFREAQRWMPRRTRLYVFEAEALRTAGDPVAAAAACRRGLVAAEDRTELEALLRALGSATAAQTR
jgi:spermidine synthase/Flp pilus assembly protein TadD